MAFNKYLKSLIDGIPYDVYLIAFAVFLIGTIFSLWLYDWKRGFRLSIGLLLFEYVFLIYGSTVFFRQTAKMRLFDMTPLWSYASYFRGEDKNLLTENIMNMVVFVPIGFLLGTGFQTMSWRKIVLTGMSISIGIEILQFLFQKGFTELDDVIHNTIGCMIGYVLWLAVVKACHL